MRMATQTISCGRGRRTLGLWPNFERFWTLAKSLKHEIKEEPSKKKSDQFIMGKIQQNYTNEVGLMPDNWSVHIGHGYRQYPQSLFDKNKVDAGILHFTGNIDNYFSGQDNQ